MKKLFLAVCTLVTVAGGSSLLWAQHELEPCGPVPAGCTVTKPCTCEWVGNVKVCSDEYQCPLP